MSFANMEPGMLVEVIREGQLAVGVFMAKGYSKGVHAAFVLYAGDLAILQHSGQLQRHCDMVVSQYEGPGSEVLKRLMTTPANQARGFYRNIRHAADGSAWQALLWLPGRGNFEVGQHKHQLVAACIADDAADVAAAAGLSVDKQKPRNFDPVTRHMALQHLGVKEVPAPNIPQEYLEALRQGFKRPRPSADSTPTPTAAAAPKRHQQTTNSAFAPPSKRHKAHKAPAPTHQRANPSVQPPMVLAQHSQHSQYSQHSQHSQHSHQQDQGSQHLQQQHAQHTQQQGVLHTQQLEPQGPTSRAAGSTAGQLLQPAGVLTSSPLPTTIPADQNQLGVISSNTATQMHPVQGMLTAESVTAAAVAAAAADAAAAGNAGKAGSWPADAVAAAVAAAVDAVAVLQPQQQQQHEQVGPSQGVQGPSVTLPAAAALLHGAAAGQLSSGMVGLRLEETGSQDCPVANLGLQDTGSQHANSTAAAPAPLEHPLQQQASEGGPLAGIGPESAAVAADLAAAAASDGEHEQGGSIAAGASAAGDTGLDPVDDPSLALLRFSQQQLSRCRLQAGQEVRLQRRTLKAGIKVQDYLGRPEESEDAEGEGGQEVLRLRVLRLRGWGATGEVYDVQVLHHDLAAGSVSAADAPPAAESADTAEESDASPAEATAATPAAAAPLAGYLGWLWGRASAAATAGKAEAADALPAATAAAAPSAAAAGSLTGQMLCLKVCRAFEQVPEQLRACQFFDSDEYYIQQMAISMAKHHGIMSGLSAGAVVHSHMHGSVGVGGVGVPALLMERASSVSVEVKLQQKAGCRRGQLGLGKQLTHRIIEQVLDGVYAVHHHGWAYLDLKPANVVVLGTAWEGKAKDVWCKLVDFGSAQHMGSTDRRTVPRWPGSPAYMSPEWWLQDIVSYKADIWALGVLLIELRIGQAPKDELPGLLGQDPQTVEQKGLHPLPLRIAKHQATLQAMKQSPKYATITQEEWSFIEYCLGYDREARPDGYDLYDHDYIIDGPS